MRRPVCDEQDGAVLQDVPACVQELALACGVEHGRGQAVGSRIAPHRGQGHGALHLPCRRLSKPPEIRLAYIHGSQAKRSDGYLARM